ncbi:MAG: hypothetical protein R3F43_23160 [bacterium]
MRREISSFCHQAMSTWPKRASAAYCSTFCRAASASSPFRERACATCWPSSPCSFARTGTSFASTAPMRSR